jgi:predicted MFS family arabinose efflux permease
MGLVGGGSMTVFVFSVFIRPVTEAFGWSRGQFGAALGASSLVGAISLPLIGWALDRYGIRKVLLPAIVAFAATTGSLALLQPSLPMLFAIFILIGIAGAAQSAVPYSKVIAVWFDDHRGLALGLAIAGTGISTALMPLLAQTLTGLYGWRVGYAGLGIASFLVAFPAVALFMRDMPTTSPTAASPELPGTLARDAVRSGRFWILVVAFYCGVTAVNGVMTQAVALLGDRGIPPQTAAASLAATGLIVIVSRLVAGVCVDRFHAPFVCAVFFGISMIGIAMLAAGVSGTPALIGMMLCGVAIGAELDLMAFLVSRYFGLRAFGTIFGYLFIVLPVGVGSGSALMGIVYDRAHSYEPMLIAFVVMSALCCVLLLGLGPYVYPRRPAAAGEAFPLQPLAVARD